MDMDGEKDLILTGSTGNRGLAYSGLVLVGASAVVAVMMLASGPTSSAASPAAPRFPAHATTAAGDMPGMDHGSGGMPTSSPSPTMAGDMTGMDHGSGGVPSSSPAPTTSGDSPWKTHDHSGTKSHEHGSGASPAKTDEHGSGGMPGMDHGTPVRTVARPLAPVLGVFGGGASAVMLSAGLLRRKDRARSQAKQAARDAPRGQK